MNLKDKLGIRALWALWRVEKVCSGLSRCSSRKSLTFTESSGAQCLCQRRAFSPVPDVGSLRAVNLHWTGSACMFWTLTADHSLRPHAIIQSYWFRLSSLSKKKKKKQDWPRQWNLILKHHNVAGWSGNIVRSSCIRTNKAPRLV